MPTTQYTPAGWDDASGVVRYESPDLGWIEPTRAVVIDAGNNVVAAAPARGWRRLARKHAALLSTGRAQLIGAD